VLARPQVLRPFRVEYIYEETPDAEERLRRAVAILWAAGRRIVLEEEAQASSSASPEKSSPSTSQAPDPSTAAPSEPAFDCLPVEICNNRQA
jgi:hypothetical protein